jgi:flagellin
MPAFDGSNILNNSLTADLAFLANSDATETIDPDAPESHPRRAGPGRDGRSDQRYANAATALGLVETALATATSRMAALGAESKRIDQHLVFISKLADSLETGVGQLVDADLAKESARLQALQVQQQLGAQALSIANSAPQMVLSLFRSS